MPALRGVAIVGFGKIAETTHLPAFDLVPGFEVRAIVEPVPTRREAARAARPEAHVYATLAEALSEGGIDLVDVCTPPQAHFEACALALTRGVNVLCEKPLVTKATELAELSRLTERAGGPLLFCMHNWKHGKVVAGVRDAIASGRIGRPQRVEIETLRTQPAAGAPAPGQPLDWRLDPDKAGGGIAFDHGWHMISMALAWLGGGTPVAVRATTEQRRFKDAPVEDTVTLEAELSSGTLRLFATWAGAERDNRGRVVGTDGEVRFSAAGYTVAPAGRVPEATETDESLAAGGYRPSWNAGVLREVLAELSGERPRGSALAEARTCLRILLAGYESARQGGARTLP